MYTSIKRRSRPCMRLGGLSAGNMGHVCGSAAELNGEPKKQTENETQNTSLTFPIIADADKKIAALYDMIHPSESNTATVRSVFIMDPEMKVRLTMTYPMAVGSNFDEILRVLDALQTGDKHGIATPADWQPGNKVIIPPSVNNADASAKFPQGFDEIKPYLRFVQV